jgi:glucose/arabinose dehydrogenase
LNLGRSRLAVRALVAAGVALLAVLAVVLLRDRSSSASTTTTVLPTGFTDTEWVSGLHRPYQMEFSPDGRLFVSQQGGRLRVIKDGELLPDPFLAVEVDSHGDRGLIGVAFDPQFAVNHFVYVYYTAATPLPHNRVSRFTAAGDLAVAGSEKILIELPDLGTATIHNGGSIHFGGDGKLYIATGENVQGAVAQSMTSLLGKILRLNPDGSIPSDNPFFSTATGNFRAIWALGLRNPYTFGIQPGTGRILINDVGADAWEEIDEGISGANYGWPTTEGPTTNPHFTSPLFVYGHGTTETTGCAIAGGTFYNTRVPQFPASYNGDYFFADACNGWIRVLDPAKGTAQPFLSAGIGLVDVKTGPDGNLYYLSRLNDVNNPGFVHKVTFSEQLTDTDDRAPVGTIETPSAGSQYDVGDNITFTGSAEDPEDGTLPPSAFAWDVVFHDSTHIFVGPPIGAGATGDGRSGSFVMPDTGATSADVFFRIQLTVTDSEGRSTESFVDVLPNAVTPGSGTVSTSADTIEPVVSVSEPVDGAVVSGTMNLAATVSDDGGVTAVKWYVDNREVASDSVGPPWSESWTAASLPDGPHKIFAKARDAAGNWGTSVVLTFTVDNT